VEWRGVVGRNAVLQAGRSGWIIIWRSLEFLCISEKGFVLLEMFSVV
jgi:hypothetical protein